jgi:alpha-glucuronidase
VPNAVEAAAPDAPPVSDEVAGWWRAAVAEASAGLHPLARAYLERARPACHTGVTALVVAHTDGEAVRLARDAHVLADALARASAGAACEVLVLSPQQWRARQDDVRRADGAPNDA